MATVLQAHILAIARDAFDAVRAGGAAAAATTASSPSSSSSPGAAASSGGARPAAAAASAAGGGSGGDTTGRHSVAYVEAFVAAALLPKRDDLVAFELHTDEVEMSIVEKEASSAAPFAF